MAKVKKNKEARDARKARNLKKDNPITPDEYLHILMTDCCWFKESKGQKKRRYSGFRG